MRKRGIFLLFLPQRCWRLAYSAQHDQSSYSISICWIQTLPRTFAWQKSGF
jgi:hypothetical protein